MTIDLAPLLRRVLLAAGLPLFPGCSDGALPLAEGRDAAASPMDALVSVDALVSPTDGLVSVVDGLVSPVVDARASPVDAATCIGTWGMDTVEGGCRSGPYMTRRDRYLPIATTSIRHIALYQQCLASLKCPDELCLELIDYKPVSNPGLVAESWDKLVTCEPACKDGAPGVHTVYTLTGSCAGRRPGGYEVAATVVAATDLGAFFAEMARLEAASVPAFERLARELGAHGAPAALVAAAQRAMTEEVRHFHITSALARRFGATADAPVVPQGDVRPLEEIAVENAAEGCAGETFGAAIAGWQAAAAEDPTVRAALPGIARDEAGHATLAWQVDAWARSTVSSGARRRVDEAREERILALRTAAAMARVSDDLQRRAGVPGPEVQVALLERMRRELGARATWDYRVSPRA
jgi:hypothetical protein